MIYQSDYLVIGSGIAGLSFALQAAKTGTVTLITKKEFQESNTNYAQGGIASVLHPSDSFDLHRRDTLQAGAGLCREDVVDMVVRAGPKMVEALIAWGAEFTRSGSNLALGREGGHSKNRIVYAADLTGREIERALTQAAGAHPNIAVYEHHMAIDLIAEPRVSKSTSSASQRRTCWGVYALDTNRGQVKTFLAKYTLLCSGGCGQIYLHSTNPAIATGDGIAMAYRAGASVGNLEFMQFHPTTLFHSKANSFLISEAVRGHGGILVDRAGRAFMVDYHAMGELAPRDVVARAIDSEMKKTGDPCVYLDITHCPRAELQERFPTIYAQCMQFGIDMARDPIPVVPAAHYMCGGVFTDTWGRTDINRLFASGEVACTGLHGANRLASNSLLEALFFSHRAYAHIQRDADARRDFPDIPAWRDAATFQKEKWRLLSSAHREVQELMWDDVGIVRSDLRLKRAARRIDAIAREVEAFYTRSRVTEALLELRNMTTVAALTIRCALSRRESRGLHHTLDCPDMAESARDTLIQEGERGEARREKDTPKR